MLAYLTTLAADNPAAHVYNHYFLKSEGGLWLWSGNQGNLLLSGLIVILGGLWFAKQVRTGPAEQGTDRYITRNRFAHMIEVICVYLREQVVRPLLHDRTDKIMPFLWSLFFFILVNNLLGLVPLLDIQHVLSGTLRSEHRAFVGGTATQNIWVTGGLALIAALVFNLAAITRLGMGGYLKHMTGGAPLLVAPMIFFLEFLGQIVIKPVALAVRLFANMTAGHILLATLIGFAAGGIKAGILVGTPVTLIALLGSIAVMFLELFVAFLQAFIFMFLTTVFISLMDHHGSHEHDHGHAHVVHGHEHAHA